MYIKGENIFFKYSNSKQYTIRDFHINMNKGDVLAILGESGSGKSTILRILSGLESIESGKIEIDGKVIVSDDVFIEPENRGIGMVFQDYALFPHMTVKKNIEYGLKGIGKKEKYEIVNSLLGLIKLSDHKDKYPYELSGGQQQRVAIARAIAPRPSVILLDEPFSNLDANLRETIRDEIKDILNKSNITSIFVTHDKEDAKQLANKVIILDKGKMIDEGLTKDILK